MRKINAIAALAWNWPTTFDWQGVLSVQTSGTADGNYSHGNGLEALSWRTNIDADAFDYHAGDQPRPDPVYGRDGVAMLFGLEPGASVMIAAGKIVDG